MATILGPRFADAIVLASEVHRHQLRKGTEIPYISHLLGVASLVLEFGGTEDEAIAGLLHDSIEDSDGHVTESILAARFGDAVAAIVDGCTDARPGPGEEKEPWQGRKDAYLDHLGQETNRSVILVSASDKLYNITSILNDYRSIGDPVFERFSVPKERTLWYYTELVEAYRSVEERFTLNAGNVDDVLGALLDRFEGTVEELKLELEMQEFESALEKMVDDEDLEENFPLA